MDIRDFGQAFIQLHKTIYHSSIPVIAAIKGKVIGGGFSLVDACDLAVSDVNSGFSVPEIKSGIAPMLALIGVKNVLNKKRSLEMAYFGEEIGAKTAEKYGFLNKICPKDQVEAEAEEMALKIASYNSNAIKLCKELYISSNQLTYEEKLEEALLYLVMLLKAEN
jgi:enoyl-CoA hydratase/carnithine racemase